MAWTFLECSIHDLIFRSWGSLLGELRYGLLSKIWSAWYRRLLIVSIEAQHDRTLMWLAYFSETICGGGLCSKLAGYSIFNAPGSFSYH